MVVEKRGLPHDTSCEIQEGQRHGNLSLDVGKCRSVGMAVKSCGVE